MDRPDTSSQLTDEMPRPRFSFSTKSRDAVSTHRVNLMARAARMIKFLTQTFVSPTENSRIAGRGSGHQSTSGPLTQFEGDSVLLTLN